MGKRSTSRRLAMQALYQAEIGKIDIETAFENVISAEKFIPETIEFARTLSKGTWNKRQAIDEKIAQLSIDWPLDRLGKVDHSILRLAIYELDRGETPASVVIDEAVELAKKYSNEDAAKFINGILGAYLKSKEFKTS